MWQLELNFKHAPVQKLHTNTKAKKITTSTKFGQILEKLQTVLWLLQNTLKKIKIVCGGRERQVVSAECWARAVTRSSCGGTPNRPKADAKLNAVRRSGWGSTSAALLSARALARGRAVEGFRLAVGSGAVRCAARRRRRRTGGHAALNRHELMEHGGQPSRALWREAAPNCQRQTGKRARALSLDQGIVFRLWPGHLILSLQIAPSGNSC